jgi:hypothetical protein
LTFEAFKISLQQSVPPAGISKYLLAIWYDGKGNWEKAHDIVQQDESDKTNNRIHAYLHRKEGDDWNAGYWYKRSSTTFFNGSLDDEWLMIVMDLL